LVISGAGQIPFLVVLFGVLGGLSAFGAVGLFFGAGDSGRPAGRMASVAKNCNSMKKMCQLVCAVFALSSYNHTA